MILAVDIGNTMICWGLVSNQKIHKAWRTRSDLPDEAFRREAGKILREIKRSPLVFSEIQAVVVCSVVPRVLRKLKPLLRRSLNKKILIVGGNIHVPIKNCYRDPRQVGQDRLVGAYAARSLYGTPLIVVDLGTAITFDVISRQGTYLGGMIVPGIRLSAESLFKKTALLPLVDIKGPKEIIGRDTENSILSGIFYGYGALCDGVIGLLAQKIKSRPRVIVTGGYADLMKRYAGRFERIDEDLVLKGLELLYRCRISSRSL